MEVRLESTEGLGGAAEVLINGEPYYVCDGISPREGRLAPGVLEGVKFTYMTEAGFSWEQALRGNPAEERILNHVKGWGYQGLGRVIQIMPVLVDYGVLEMEDSNWTNDESLIGRYVTIPIDRLEIVSASQSDWPEHLR
jgi:hypothetical protein